MSMTMAGPIEDQHGRDMKMITEAAGLDLDRDKVDLAASSANALPCKAS